MERKYTYKNGTVYIVGLNEKSIKNIQDKTKHFLKRVMKEQYDGNIDKTRTSRN